LNSGLITKLISEENYFWDSYMVLTIEKPRARHPQKEDEGDQPTFLTAIKFELDALKELEKSEEYKHVFWVHQKNPSGKEKKKNYDDFNSALKNIEYQRINNIPDFKNFSKDWLYNFNNSKKFDRAKNRAKNVLRLYDELSNNPQKLFDKLTFSPKESIDEQHSSYNLLEIDEKQIISAFVTFLAFFRQPRTIPMLHSIIQRWVLREGEGCTVEEKEQHAIKIHATIHSLIEGMSPLAKNKLEMPRVVQKHEGGSVWLYREVHECTYNAQTEFLHRKSWFPREQSNKDEGKQCVAAMLDGMIFVSWHLLIARTYYVDIFLPTKDIKSFYEYLYHRVTAIRTISLLLHILDIIEKKNYGCFFIKNLASLFEKSESRNVGKLKEEDNYLALFWYIEEIGFFSQIPEHKSSYSNKTENQRNPNEKALVVFKKDLKALYMNSLKTLLFALTRNQLIFLAQSAPDTVDAWSNQFLKVDFRQMFGVDLCRNEPEITDHLKLFGGIDKLFIAFFEEQKLYAEMSRLNFKGIIDNGIEETELKSDLPNKKMTIKECEEWLNNIDLKNKDNRESNISKYMRCYLFLDCKHLAVLSTSLHTKICDVKEITEDDESALLVRELISLKGKALIVQWPFWQPLLDRELPIGDIAVDDLKKVEKASIAYEDTLRMTAKTIEEDAFHRSTAFSLRARSLYLQGHFSEAHHFLDIASTGLLDDRVDHRVKASVIHLVRAELLSTSAEKKYKDSLKDSDNKKNDFKFNQLSELNTSLKKIKRANQELLQAERLLQDIAHEKIWIIVLEFGFAQLQLEKLLFRMELLELGNNNMSEFKFLKENGSLERSILEGMQRLRNVLDLIPFDSRLWQTVNDATLEQKEDSNSANFPMLIMFERMCYKLWKHFFVVGGYYSRLLNIQYHSGQVGKASTTYSVFGDKRYGERWSHWCYSMRFPKLGKCVLTFSSIYSNNSEVLNEESYFVDSSSLRALVIEIMKESCDDKIAQMWDARRSFESREDKTTEE